MQPGIYRHFKGALYKVIHTARHSETEEVFVVYHPLDMPESWWIRPEPMFNEMVERDGRMIKRFELIEIMKEDQTVNHETVGNK